MTTTWGSYDGHLRLGIDLTTSAATTGSTVTVSVKLYVQVDSTWNFEDNQNWKLSGTGGSSGSFYNSLDNNNSKLLYSTSFTASVDYDGGPTYSYSASLSGAYNGASPTHSRSITLPARQATVPAAPGAPTVSSIGATQATFTWNTPATNGSALTGNAGQVSASSSFSSLTASWQVSGWAGRVVTGLPKGTALYARVRAQNGEGWSAWSPAKAFTTLTTVPDAPGTPTVSNAGPQTADVAWTAPADDGGTAITSYRVQYSADSGFASYSEVESSALSTSLSGLTPGTTYYVRVVADNATGSSSASGAASFLTNSAVYVGNGTTWVAALIYVGDGTNWIPATVKTGDGTNWK